jgi:hypothetical protein
MSYPPPGAKLEMMVSVLPEKSAACTSPEVIKTVRHAADNNFVDTGTSSSSIHAGFRKRAVFHVSDAVGEAIFGVNQCLSKPRRTAAWKSWRKARV